MYPAAGPRGFHSAAAALGVEVPRARREGTAGKAPGVATASGTVANTARGSGSGVSGSFGSGTHLWQRATASHTHRFVRNIYGDPERSPFAPDEVCEVKLPASMRGQRSTVTGTG